MSDNKVTVQLGKERETKKNGRGRVMFKPPGNPKCDLCERRIKGAIYFQSPWHGKPTCGDCAREIEWQRVVRSHELFGRDEPLPDRANTRADQLPRTRPCEVCGREIGWAVFRRHEIRTWTCSFDCECHNAKRRVEPQPKTCEHCGETFTPKRSDARTCSDRCWQLSRASRINVSARADARAAANRDAMSGPAKGIRQRHGATVATAPEA
jgi:hypothetical protein